MGKTGFISLLLSLGLAGPLLAQPVPVEGSRPITQNDLERASPTLRRWLANPPDLLEDIENGQAFPTRLGIGISLAGGRSEAEYSLTLQDVVLGGTRASFSADFYRSGVTNQQWGANARYYIAPLGSYFNVAPLVGYRSLVIDGNARNGAELGAKLLFALSPRAADIAVSQSWVLPAQGPEIGRTLLEFGYTLSPIVRLTAVIQLINSNLRQETSFGMNLELIGF